MGEQYDWIRWLPKALAAEDVPFVKYPGWRTRGLGDYRPWIPDTFVWHHDASGKGDSPWVPDFIVGDIENHGAQVWVDRYGVWHLLAAGRVGHTGRVRPGKPDNERAVGVETDHTSGEKWPDALLESLRAGTAAAFLDRGWDSDALHFHKTICDPVGAKVDPWGLNLSEERKRVARLMKPEVAKPYVSLGRAQRLAKQSRWSRGYGPEGREQVALIEDALDAEGIGNYRKWQQSLGYDGDDADGIPGRVSLTRLGRKHGFAVTS